MENPEIANNIIKIQTLRTVTIQMGALSNKYCCRIHTFMNFIHTKCPFPHSNNFPPLSKTSSKLKYCCF